MNVVISASGFRKNFAQFMNTCVKENTSVTIIKNSKPTAVLVNNKEYEDFQKWKKYHFWEGIKEAETEISKGEGKKFKNVENFLEDLND